MAKNPGKTTKMNQPFLVCKMMVLLSFIMGTTYIVQACPSKFPITVTTDKEDITSPNYPSFYPNNKECRWLISAPLNKLVQFRLKVYDLAQPADYIEVRDGVNESAVVLKNFTTKPKFSFIPFNWRSSSGRFLWMKFKSDRVYRSTGFMMDIRFVNKPKACSPSSPEIIRKDGETIIGPYSSSFYPNNQECTWVFVAPRTDQVVHFDFRILKDGLAQGDYIELRDGMNASSSLMMNYTSKSILFKPRLIPTSGRYLWIKFKSDKEFNGQGFSITYYFENKPKACLSPSSPQPLQTSYGKIQSPFYEWYPVNQECTWLITVPHLKLIKFYFHSFDLAQPGDYLEIRDGATFNAVVLQNFSSRPNLSNKWISSGRNLWLKFKSDGVDTDKGFSMFYHHIDKPKACIHQQGIAVEENDITSPFYPSFYPNNQQCTWIITANKPDHVVAFRMKHLDLVQPGDYVEVRDGIDDNAVLLQIFTSKSNLSDELRTSSGRFMRVKFKSDHQHTAKGFRMFIQFINKTFADVPTSLATPSFTSKDILASTSERVSNATNNLAGGISLRGNTVKQKRQVQKPISATIGMGLSIGVIVLLVLLFIIFLKKRKNQLKNRYPDSKDPWEISLSRVELVQELGHGAFGRVWKGNMDSNEMDKTNNVTQSLIQNKQANKKDVVVAVKMLHDSAISDEKQEFLREIEFMKNVGYHRNIISMVACCTKEEQVFLVVEFAANGDLLNFLRDKRKQTYVKFHLSENKQTSAINSDNEEDEHQSVESLLDELMSFSWQIAQGMEYLSSKGIVHRDLAARNILVAEDFVKVADFGLSRHVTYEEQVYQAQVGRKLPLKWMSPEAIDDQIFTSKSDVWSYGVVLWEIYSLGKLPYRSVCNQQLLTFLKEGRRMEKPDLCPDEIYELMNNCWEKHAQDRPSFSDVIDCVETYMTRNNPYIDLLNEEDDGYLVPLELSN